MEFEFDPAKDRANLAKHGISLAFGVRLFDDRDRIILGASRPVDGEDRFKVIALAENRLYTAIFVWRGETVRFISVRRSNPVEERTYHRD